jgi:paraquat-inducible protein B
MEIQPERIRASSKSTVEPDPERVVPMMIERGLRVQMRTSSLVTGQKLLAIDFFPDAPVTTLRKEGEYFVIPSVPAPGQEIVADLVRIADRLAAVPFDEIGQDLGTTADGLARLVDSDVLQAALDNLSTTLAESSALLATVNKDVAPNIANAVAQIDQTVVSLRELVDADTGAQREITRLVTELTDAARSVRALTDYLERHPEALLKGKGGPQ